MGSISTEGHRPADRKRPDQRHALGPRRRDPFPGRPTSSRKRLLDAGIDLRGPLRGRRPRSHHERGRRITALTHGDRAAWEGTAIFHELIRLTFEDTDPSPRSQTFWLSSTPTTAAATPPSSRPTGTPIRRPSSTVPSGPAWAPPSGPCAPPPASNMRYARQAAPCFLAVGVSCDACRTGARGSPAR